MMTASSNPTSSIRKKIGGSIKIEDIFTKERLQECEAIIEKAHEDFIKEVVEMWEVILVDFITLSSNPDRSADIIKKIAADAFTIKGKLDELGYGLGMNIAKSLYDFAVKDTTPERHMTIYSKHVDAINTVLKKNIKGDGGVVGEEMLKALSALIGKLG